MHFGLHFGAQMAPKSSLNRPQIALRPQKNEVEQNIENNIVKRGARRRVAHSMAVGKAIKQSLESRGTLKFLGLLNNPFNTPHTSLERRVADSNAPRIPSSHILSKLLSPIFHVLRRCWGSKIELGRGLGEVFREFGGVLGSLGAAWPRLGSHLAAP